MLASNIVLFPVPRSLAPAFPVPARSESLTRTFDEPGRFTAMEAARLWLARRTFSSSVMEGPNALGIRYGQHRIPKWSHMGARDRLTLHGRVTGDMINGPVTVEIFASAPEAAKAAFLRDETDA